MANKKKNLNLTQSEIDIRNTFIRFGYNYTSLKYDVSVEYIEELIKRIGSITIRYRNRQKEWKDEVAAYYQGHSLPQTAIKYFVTPKVINDLIEEYGLPVRSRSDELHLSRVNHYGSWNSYVESMNAKMVDTCMKKYNVSNGAKTQAAKNKSVETFRLNYGVDNIMQSTVGKASYNATMRERYGVDWPMQSQELLDKSTKTFNDVYGGRGSASPEIKAKVTTTFESNYGVTHWRYSDELTAKVNETCRLKEGVDWPCQYKHVKHYSNNSGPNMQFEKELSDAGIEFEREFGIRRYSFDFRIDKILVEIDPSSTHNSTLSLFPSTSPTPNDYHYKKSMCAIDNGYECIHVYDWMLYSDVIDYIKNYNNPVTYDLNSDVVFLSYNKRNIDIMSSLGYVVDSVVPQAHYYNMRTREHYMLSPTDMKGFVVVYDEGQIKFIKKVINNF